MVLAPEPQIMSSHLCVLEVPRGMHAHGLPCLARAMVANSSPSLQSTVYEIPKGLGHMGKWELWYSTIYLETFDHQCFIASAFEIALILNPSRP